MTGSENSTKGSERAAKGSAAGTGMNLVDSLSTRRLSAPPVASDISAAISCAAGVIAALPGGGGTGGVDECRAGRTRGGMPCTREQGENRVHMYTRTRCEGSR